MTSPPDDTTTDTSTVIAALCAERDAALAVQAALAEVMEVINRNPGDLALALNTILAAVLRLSGSAFGALQAYEAGLIQNIAVRPTQGMTNRWRQTPFPLDPGTLQDRIVNGEDIVSLADIRDDDAYRAGVPSRVITADVFGARSLVIAGLRKEGRLLGFINIFRTEIRPFTEAQLTMVKAFAAQAVIAMENARLITDQREALEQQTATAEVLQAINANPGNLTPVFDAMLERALRLCDAAFGNFWTYDGEFSRLAATSGASPEYLAELTRAGPQKPEPGSASMRLIEGEPLVHIADIVAEGAHRSSVAVRRMLADRAGARTVLWVPLRKDGGLVGFFAVYRTEVRPFTDKQIALLQNFAAQAVIAMENARLLTETREALEQQTATAEVLQVINASPGNLVPVFDAILVKAHNLCSADHGSLYVTDGEAFRAVAVHGMPDAFADLIRRPFRPGPNHPVRQLLAGTPFAVVHDATEVDDPIIQGSLKLAGMRSALFVPLRKDKLLLGYIVASSPERRVFTEKQVALLQNFASQAVIAMENARLITEQREALEQQTATAEVLQVINASPGDLVPVFNAILEKAHGLCDVTHGVLVLREGEIFRAVATHSYSGSFAEALRQGYRGADNPLTLALINGERFVHIPDLAQIDHPMVRASVELGGVRTGLFVPLRKDDVLLGMISSTRREIRPFSDKEIALVENFAAQAVIAMENARLLTEQHEALERQTATAEVLQVINASPGNLAPVYEAILEKAHDLCDIAYGDLQLYDGEHLRSVAQRGLSAGFADRLRQGYRASDSPASRPLLAGDRFTHITDVAAVDSMVFRSAVRLDGIRTVLFVPLRKDGLLLGMITSARIGVRPFTEKEIALVENFAAQAVIAMENARLLTEQREALEQQTAIAEVLQVINASPGNLTPVFDAILEKSMRLCEASVGTFYLKDGDLYPMKAARGLPDGYAAFRGTRPPYKPHPDSPPARVQETRAPLQVLDMRKEDAYLNGYPETRALVDLGGARTVLYIPLLKEEAVTGTVVMYRQEVRLFTERQIALLQNFAAQAVIAMDNARLLDEIRQRQAELRTTFDNMGDGVAMFDTDLRLAAWNRNFQQIIDLPDTILETRPSYADYLRLLAERGEFGTTDIEAQLSLRMEDTDKELRLERVRPDGRVIEVRRNAVPGGGFVLIYSDITERKRSEEEIRAARDAAETALRELKTAQANLIQAEKMASLGQLTAGIAHEIKNPLNFVNNFAALSVDLLGELKETAAPGFAALTEKQRAEVEEVSAMLTSNLEKITEHGKRADGIVKAMLEHSRGSSGERRMVDLNALIDEALNLAYHGARAQDQSFNITLERDFGEGIAPIEVNPQDITRVFLNIFSNGFYATTNRARAGEDAGFVPTLKVITRDAGEAVEIRVRDNGTGIPVDIRDKLFQPFFTTKPTGEGTGLGLSITYDIVTKQHGGSIDVDSHVAEYSEFAIRLPRQP